jgi:hypothetical protein
MSVEVRVGTYCGYKSDEHPVWFELDGRRLVIKEVRCRWRAPEGEVFKVLAKDGQRYILKNKNGSWELGLTR